MEFPQLVLANRSYRRFNEAALVSMQTLEELTDLARQTPSAQNLQPLRYALVNDRDTVNTICAAHGWAGFLPHWRGPEEGERPGAYILIMKQADDENALLAMDTGIAAQTILLGAVAKGLGGCMIGSMNKEKIHAALGLPEDLAIVLIIALGEPAETVKLVPLDATDTENGHKYYRDEAEVHYVPKRGLDEVVVARIGA